MIQVLSTVILAVKSEDKDSARNPYTAPSGGLMRSTKNVVANNTAPSVKFIHKPGGLVQMGNLAYC